MTFATIARTTPTGRRFRLPSLPWAQVRLWGARALAVGLVLGGLGCHVLRCLPPGAEMEAAAVVKKPKGNTCTGLDPCPVCRSCKACRLCAKDGGQCGTKRRILEEQAKKKQPPKGR